MGLISPLSNDLYVIPRAIAMWKKDGSDRWFNLGSCDSIELELSVEEVEKFDNSTPNRVLAKRVVSQVAANINLTLAQMSNFVRAASLMAAEQTRSQGSASDATFTIPADAKAGDVFALPHKKVSGFSVAGDLTLAELNIDAEAGLVEVTADASATTTLTYDAAAITSGLKAGIASTTGIRGALMLRQVQLVGPKSLVMLHDVQLRPAAARAFVSDGNEFGSLQLSGAATPVSGQPVGFEIGYEEHID